ncbi:hypothetical protein STEG23_029542, partial [Scotinomys teguina]
MGAVCRASAARSSGPSCEAYYVVQASLRLTEIHLLICLPLIPIAGIKASLHDKMANPKEKTPMCLVNELARFHSIQPQYKLLSESGPAHSK